MSTQTLELAAPLRLDDGDDDLLHSVCDTCSRILCDGEVCTNPWEADDCAAEELCVVCEDLDGSLVVCPYCGAVLWDSPP